ncbi:hypothetical protein ACIOHC_36270 [Streptomyces sp. NPDC088252]|uniref:hypothetical protein n=1 Tax=Streptomyces sp. NPDC088252 TaxID=3365845 RepID=UPI0037FC2B97
MFTDLAVKVRLLTRTCGVCNETVEIVWVPNEIARVSGGTTWRMADKQRKDWWADHQKSCRGA